jgi:hypothetical protein
MRSRAERRSLVEWPLRVALAAALAAALWRSLHQRARGPETRSATGATLGRTLREATRDSRVGVVRLDVDSVPTTVERAWLGALRRAGVEVGWRGAPAAIAVAAERARQPVSSVHVLLAADTGAAIALADSAGALDTLAPRGGGASLDAADVVGAVQARRGAVTARASLPAGTERRAVLVLGRAGWESKFVLAALGEAGWQVRGRLPAAPSVAVSDPGLLPIDTARYDAVVALDSTAGDLALAVARFVNQGGGLIAAGGATTLDALRPLVPARAGVRQPGRILLDADSVTPADLPLRPLVALRADAVTLERRAAGPATAARRAGRGRVLAVGYDETWRWRMLGGAGGVGAHRAWWSRMAGLVAPDREPVNATRAGAGADAAPLAALVDALGPPAAASRAHDAAPVDPLPLALLVVILAALLAETASRRFRGAR